MTKLPAFISVIQRAMIVMLLLICMPATPVLANNSYSDGSYGTCQYNECGITVNSGGTLSLNVAPGAGKTCTVAADTVSVLTDSSTGYSLLLGMASGTSQMTGGPSGLPATSGSFASPAMLDVNSWGFRVDGSGNFGAGPTAAVSNGTTGALTYAAIPPGGMTNTVASTASAANPAITTKVWYGICVDVAIQASTYTANVMYTAVVN